MCLSAPTIGVTSRRLLVESTVGIPAESAMLAGLTNRERKPRENMKLLRLVYRVFLDFLVKLIGAFDLNKMQVSRDDIVIVYEDCGDERDLRIFVPYEIASEDPEYVERICVLMGWALLKPPHFWKSTELGIDALESARQTVLSHTD